ncbi:MAG: site-2 protease family protein [Defluviitaleaceae bacterium]|nr:site-2 protease family protein [Defluviitaleaceae bacterium]
MPANFSIPDLIIRIIVAFLALTIHEFVKARCTTLLGDPTPKRRGFMTGKPLKYVDPLGLIIAVLFGFGWGKPVPTSPLYYKDRYKGTIITYAMPSLFNLFLGLLTAVSLSLLNLVPVQVITDASVSYLISSMTLSFIADFAFVNVCVALFNFIPVPPLDAAKLLQITLSAKAAYTMAKNEKLLQLMLILLIFLGVMQSIIHPVAYMIVSVMF